jgi:hypothetical protein
MCGMLWCYAKCRGVDIELANNGDDCVVFMERSNLERFMRGFAAWFARCGFAMTVGPPVYEFEQVEFCQTSPVLLSTGWRMVRNHLSCLRKDPMCLVPINAESSFRKWLGAVGECGRILASGVPVQEAFYTAFETNGVKASEGYKEVIFRNTSMAERVRGVKTAVITAESRVSYYYAFGVTPDEQCELERYYASAIVGCVDAAPVFRRDLHFEPGLINLLRSNEE